MAEFATAPLADVLARVIDHRGRTPKKLGGDFVPSGVRVLSALNVQDGRIDDSDQRFITEEMWHRWMPEKLCAGDVLLTSEAPLGQTAYLASNRPVCLGQRLFALRADERRLHGRFLYYFLSSEYGQRGLEARATGTTVIGIRQSELLRVEVPLLPINDQQAIAQTLGALDAKIEQNRRTGRALEGLARATFKAWFVDFEPVKAKAAGATSFPGMPPAAFTAIPDSLSDSPLGPVPEEWEVGSVGDITTLSRNQINPQDHADELFEHFSIPAYDAGQNAVVEAGGGIKSQKFVVVPGCVLLSKLNPRIPRVWIPSPTKGLRQIASTEFLVAVPESGWTREFLYCLFQQGEFRDSLAQSASGTSNSHQRVRPSDLLARPLVMPPKTIHGAFTEQAAPLMALREALQAESSRLAELRDYLLPRLLNGRVRVSETGEGSS